LLCSHKFDLRIYVVVTSFRPLEAFLYTGTLCDSFIIELRSNSFDMTWFCRGICPHFYCKVHNLILHHHFFNHVVLNVLSCIRYSNSPDSFADRFVHLTNAAVQRENSVSSAADGLNGFPFPADPLQAGGTKLSLAYWRTLMTEQGSTCQFCYSIFSQFN
jgi:hypothetical protein